jgi:hypothetical protein
MINTSQKCVFHYLTPLTFFQEHAYNEPEAIEIHATKEDTHAAGEREGAKAPLVIRLIAIKNVRFGLFDERSEIFCEAQASQKMWRFHR